MEPLTPRGVGRGEFVWAVQSSQRYHELLADGWIPTGSIGRSHSFVFLLYDEQNELLWRPIV